MKYPIKQILISLLSLLIGVQDTYGQAQFVNVQAIGSSPGYAVTSFSVECIVSPITNQYTIELQRFTNSNPNWVTIDTQQWNEYLLTVSGYRIYALEDNNPLTGSTGDDGINLYRFKSTYNGNVTTSYAAYGASFDYSEEIGCSKYNDVYRRAGHNSFEEFQFRTLKDVLNTTQSIEIDYHGTGTNGRWEVRHTNVLNGNHNNCGTGDDHFDVCLDDVLEWSNENPNHEVITLFLDANTNWDDSKNKGAPDFDNLLSSSFGAKLYTPQDMRGLSNSLRQTALDGN